MPEHPKLIATLEVLARIELTPDERERLAPQLDVIIDYIRRLQDVDTAGVTPSLLVSPASVGELRADDPEECLDREIVLGEAPETDGEFYRVPRIIER